MEVTFKIHEGSERCLVYLGVILQTKMQANHNEALNGLGLVNAA